MWFLTRAVIQDTSNWIYSWMGLFTNRGQSLKQWDLKIRALATLVKRRHMVEPLTGFGAAWRVTELTTCRQCQQCWWLSDTGIDQMGNVDGLSQLASQPMATGYRSNKQTNQFNYVYLYFLKVARIFSIPVAHWWAGDFLRVNSASARRKPGNDPVLPTPSAG